MEVDSGGAMEVTGGGEIDFSGLRPRLRRVISGSFGPSSGTSRG